jgi:hypothetical protein
LPPPSADVGDARVEQQQRLVRSQRALHAKVDADLAQRDKHVDPVVEAQRRNAVVADAMVHVTQLAGELALGDDALIELRVRRRLLARLGGRDVGEPALANRKQRVQLATQVAAAHLLVSQRHAELRRHAVILVLLRLGDRHAKHNVDARDFDLILCIGRIRVVVVGGAASHGGMARHCAEATARAQIEIVELVKLATIAHILVDIVGQTPSAPRRLRGSVRDALTPKIARRNAGRMPDELGIIDNDTKRQDRRAPISA